MNGEKVILKPLNLEYCNERYLSWLKNPEINQYLETRWEEQDLTKIRTFVSSMTASSNNYIYAIIEKSSGIHLGNIKLGPINQAHSYADVSYFIGEKSKWGKGYSTEAIWLITHFGFENLDLHRLQAGVYESNIGSRRALEKVGYTLEGRLRKKLKAVEHYEDHLLYGFLKEDWIITGEGIRLHE